MKRSVKAALLSGLVFPGVGQFYLRQRAKGAVLTGLSLLALAVIIRATINNLLIVLGRIDLYAESIDPAGLTNIAVNAANKQAVYLQIASILVACCWVYSIADPYITGKRRKTGLKTTSPG